MKRSTLALLLVLAGCKAQHVTIQQPPTIDASDGAVLDDSAKACAVMAAAGCPVGSNPTCADALRADQAQGAASQVDLQCILNAGPSKVALARCNVTCQ